MTIWQFMSEHSVATVVIVYLACECIVRVVRALKDAPGCDCDEDKDDGKKTAAADNGAAE